MTPPVFWVGVWSEGFEPEVNRDVARAVTSADGARALLAVADGASGTLFSGHWAGQLVDTALEACAGGLDMPRLHARLGDLATGFQPRLDEGDGGRWQRRKWDQLGSQATLLAVEVRAESADRASVEALAVGDTDLIVVRPDPVLAFPVAEPEKFGRRPLLVSSQGVDDLVFERWTGTIEPGAVLIGATDGVARPLLERVRDEGRNAALSLALALVEGERSPRQILLDHVGTTGDDGTASLEDDATIAVCVYLPTDTGGDTKVRARTVLRRHLGVDQSPSPFRRLLESVRNWVRDGRP